MSPRWFVAITVIGVSLLIGLAMARLRSGQQSREQPAEQHYLAGREMARAGNERQAVAEWNMAIAMNPADPRPYDALATQWEASGRPDLAAETMERLARANPKAPHRDCRFARAAFAAGWITRATEAAERAVQEEPGCSIAHTMRGIVQEDAGDSDAALAELMLAHQLNPDDTRIALTLAQIEGRTGRRVPAMQRVRAVLKREPDSPQAHYLMGWLQASADPPTPDADGEAERHLRQVLKQNPDHAGAQAELGALYSRQGQYARARQLLQAARSSNPSDPTTARTLAETYTRMGDRRGSGLTAEARRLEAQQERRRSLRLRRLRQPNDAAVALQLARVELHAGQTREATDLVRQVLAADPNNRAALDLLHQALGTPAPAP